MSLTISKSDPRNVADALISDFKNGIHKTPKELAESAVICNRIMRQSKPALVEYCNSNTIDAGLQRIVLLDDMLEEFVVPLLPLTVFCTVHNNIPLEGTDEIGVPFYPLQTAASQSFVAGTGYTTMANSTTNIRKVKVGGSGDAATTGANAPVGTACDRKYLGLQFDSATLRRQPFFSAQKLAKQNANKLAVDVFQDIVSRVLTAANYGASVKTAPAVAFTDADVADLYGSATAANWPVQGRALVLDHTYNVALLKLATFKQYLSAGTTDALRKAQIQQAYGFEDIPIVPNLSTYGPAGEGLMGWINHSSAMLVATSPIMPTEEVRRLLSQYSVVTDPKTGISLSYRSFGDAVKDQGNAIVECSYGAQIGVASALKRLTSS